MPENYDWDDDEEELEQDKTSIKDIFKQAGKKILSGGDDTIHLDRVNDLVKQQNALNDKIKLLQEEKRRINEQIKKAEEPKSKVEENQKKTIATTLREIEQAQRDIRSEINKLSSKTREIKGSTQQVSSTPEEPSVGAPPPPPMGPPPPPGPFVAKKTAPLVNKAPPEPKAKATDRPTIDMGQLVGGSKNLKSGAKQVTDKTPEQIAQQQKEDIERYEKSIKNKTEEIDRLIAEVSGLSTSLKTAEASKGQYEEALEKQNELITELNQKKEALDGKLKDVKGKVSEELEKIEAKRKAEEEEKQRKAEEEQARLQSSMNTVSSAPDAPPMDGIPMPPPMGNIPKPPPMGNIPKPPPMGGLRGGKTKVTSDPDSGITQESTTQPTSAKTDKVGADMGEVLEKSLESVKRQEAKRVQEHLVGKLFDLVLKIGNGTIEEVNLDANQQRIFDAIGGEAGLNSLREALNKGLDAVPKKVNPLEAILKRREAIGDQEGPSVDVSANSIKEHKDKQELKDAVVGFIRSQPENGKELLKVSKEIKVAEEAETARLNELKRIEDARIAQENAIKAAEEQRIKEEKRALEVQAKLKEMGVSEGGVNPTGLQNAESNKERVIEDVSAKKRALDNTDNFISQIERELSSGIDQLLEAETSRDLALKEIAKKQEEIVPPQPSNQTETEPVIENPQVTVSYEEQESVSPTDEVGLSVNQQPVLESEVKPEVEIKIKPNDIPSLAEVVQSKPSENITGPETLSPEESSRKKQLVNFDRVLEGFMRKTVAYQQQGQTKEYAEALKVCTNLINARDDFIHHKKDASGVVVDAKRFIDLCEKYTSPDSTPELTKSRGIRGAIDRIVHAVKEAFRGQSTYESSNKSSKEHMSDLKNSLKEIKDPEKSTEHHTSIALK